MTSWRSTVEAATIRLPTLGGQGVLVPGGLVLTAAHCVNWNGEGGMALGDDHLEHVVTASGARFRLNVAATEPRADIAVLGAPDEQRFRADADAFSEWCNAVAPVELSARRLVPGELMPVHVLTHDRGWIEATAARYGTESCGSVWLEASEPINGGTSGGPIVDVDGRLVGVVSHSSEDSNEGMFPWARLALPAWSPVRVMSPVAPAPNRSLMNEHHW